MVNLKIAKYLSSRSQFKVPSPKAGGSRYIKSYNNYNNNNNFIVPKAEYYSYLQGAGGKGTEKKTPALKASSLLKDVAGDLSLSRVQS